MKNIKTLVSALCLAAVASFAQSQIPVLPADLTTVQEGVEYQYSATDDDQFTVVGVYICNLAYDVVGGPWPSIINFSPTMVKGSCDESNFVTSHANRVNKENKLRVIFYEDNANNVDALGMVLTASVLQEAFMKGFKVNLIYKKDPNHIYENVTGNSYPVFLKAVSATPVFTTP